MRETQLRETQGAIDVAMCKRYFTTNFLSDCGGKTPVSNEEGIVSSMNVRTIINHRKKHSLPHTLQKLAT